MDQSVGKMMTSNLMDDHDAIQHILRPIVCRALQRIGCTFLGSKAKLVLR